jgi:hypothetical protein
MNDMRDSVKNNVEHARNVQKHYYDEGKKEKFFEEGAYVMLTNFKRSKFIDDKRVGPYKVEKVLDNNNYLLSFGNDTWRAYNIKDLFAPDSKGIVIDPSKRKIDLPERQKISKDDFFKKFMEKNDEVIAVPVEAPLVQSSIPVVVDEERRGNDDVVGNKVKVWFNDKSKYYEGHVVKKKDNDLFEVKWGNNKREEVKLSPKDETRDEKNEDRWSVI